MSDSRGSTVALIRREVRRENVLLAVRDEQSAYAGQIAETAEVSLSTARRDLETLEAEGHVEGLIHDERDTLFNGRRRVYWSLTDSGREYAEALREARRKASA